MMEFQFLHFTSLFPFLVFVIVLKKLVTRSKMTTLYLSPGPRKLPFIENLHLLFSSVPPHRILRDLSLKYGPWMHLKLGEITTIVVSSPDAAKQVMKIHDTVFASRPSFIATECLYYGRTGIVFAPYCESWRQLRKICTLELLSAKRVQSFRALREKEFSNLCRWIASKAGSTINFTENVALTTYDIMTQVSIGKKTDEQALFISLGKQVVDLIGGFNIGDVYPSVKLFSLIDVARKKIERVHRELDRMFENIIDEHKLSRSVKMNDDDQGKKAEDLLDVLLRIQEDSALPLTTNSIKAVLLDVLLAGVETSVTVVDWAMVEMLRNPTTLKTAQDEVRRVFGAKGYVDESLFDELNYLKLVINETCRLHPPLPMLIPRESMEHCEIEGYQIPVKTRVIVNAWAIQRDPKYWDDPETFKPERFLDEKLSVDYKGNYFEYTPFGAGRRICPGMTCGLANVEVPLAMFLYHFDWALPDQMKPEQIDMTEHSAITARRKNELHVIPVVTRPVPLESNQDVLLLFPPLVRHYQEISRVLVICFPFEKLILLHLIHASLIFLAFIYYFYGQRFTNVL